MMKAPLSSEVLTVVYSDFLDRDEQPQSIEADQDNLYVLSYVCDEDTRT